MPCAATPRATRCSSSRRCRRGGTGRGAHDPVLSPKLQAVIGSRLRQLSPSAAQVLGLAATVGRAFRADVLAAAGTTEDELVGGLDELWRRGIIREQGTDAYDFAHGRIRDVAYDALSPPLRRRNHLRIADGLERLHGPELDAVSGELARHRDRGGRPVDAIGWYQRAAVQAQRLHANVEAVRLLGRARELVASLPPGAERSHHELRVLSALPTPLAVVEGFASPDLEAVQRRVMALSATLGTDPDPSLLRSLVMSSLCRRDFDGARAVASRLQRTAERAGDDAPPRSRPSTCWASPPSGTAPSRWPAATSSASCATSDPRRRAEHLVRFGHDPAPVCLSRLGNTLWFLGHDDEAVRAADGAVAMADAAGQPFSRGVVHVFGALLAVDLDDPGGYRDHVVALARDAEHMPLAATVGAFLGYLDVLDGRAAAGIARIRTVIDAGPRDHAPGQARLPPAPPRGRPPDHR